MEILQSAKYSAAPKAVVFISSSTNVPENSDVASSQKLVEMVDSGIILIPVLAYTDGYERNALLHVASKQLNLTGLSIFKLLGTEDAAATAGDVMRSLCQLSKVFSK